MSEQTKQSVEHFLHFLMFIYLKVRTDAEQKIVMKKTVRYIFMGKKVTELEHLTIKDSNKNVKHPNRFFCGKCTINICFELLIEFRII